MKKEPQVYFFDMDHTLQDNDSDVSWKQFLVDEGIAPPETMELVDKYFEQYLRAELDFNEFLKFQLAEFIGHTPQEMEPLLYKHFEQFSSKKIYTAGIKLVSEVKQKGKPVVLLTATNRYISKPFAEYFEMDDMIANDLELVDGKFTGRIIGKYCCKDGKVTNARAWCDKHGLSLSDAKYFGDSVSDLDILQAVGYPVAVNPAEGLRQTAEELHWPILDFRK